MTRERTKSPFAVDWPQRTTPYNSTTPTREVRQSSPEEKIRRNVACVNCRNSKVKCRLGTTPGQPCQRCARLDTTCVVDKSHKRITKRSKLEQLEQELKSIKHAIHDPAQPVSTTTRWAPPSPRSTGPLSHPEVAPALPSPSGRERAGAEAQLVEEQTVAPRRREETVPTGPTSSRTLRGHLISGPDVDYYFDRYLQIYHPYLPIITSKIPNLCFQRSATLFYTILYISCRRSTRDPALYDVLVEELTETPWLMFSAQNLTLENIHALLLLSVWPLPGVRLLADPTPTILSIANMACSQLGFHTGQGGCLQFICGVRPELEVGNEEASSTWIACQLLLNKMSVQAGLPPPSIQYSDTRCKRALQDAKWNDIIAAYDLQKWMNRFHTAMAAEMASHDTISPDTISRWEAEFDLLEPTFSHHDSEVNYLTLLSSRLEMRSYYVLTPPPILTPAFNAHYVRLYHTSLTLLRAFTALPADHISHHPISFTRTLVIASAILVSSLQQHTTCCAHLSPAESSTLAKDAWTAVRRCSLREGDMPSRVSMFMEMFWSLEVKGGLEREDVPVRVWGERLSVGVAYGCLRRMKRALIDAKKIQADGYRDREAREGAKKAMESQDEEAVPQQMADPFLGADWFMDGLEWTGNGDSFFMGLL